MNAGIIIFLLYVAFCLSILYDLFKVAKTTYDGVRSYASAGLFAALSGYLIGCYGPRSAIHFAPMGVGFGPALAVINIHRIEHGLDISIPNSPDDDVSDR